MSDNAVNLAKNGAVLTISHIIKTVMSSEVEEEAKLGAHYINFREAVMARCTLKEMRHKQPPTPVKIDKTTALGVVNKT